MTISQDDLSTCPSKGCQIGLGVLFTLFDDAEKINPFLDSIIPYIPYSGAVRSPPVGNVEILKGCKDLSTTLILCSAAHSCLYWALAE